MKLIRCIRNASAWVAALVTVAWLAGCASTQVADQSQYLGFLPKPTRVLVYDFAVSPDEVELDSGSAELDKLTRQTPRTQQEREIGRKVAEALSQHLLREIGALGIPVVRATPQGLTGTNDLVLKGQFISINEGSAAERVVIGLGMGRTDVKTMTQVYGFLKGRKMLLDEFDVDAKSGSQPGMAETMGVGALMGHLAVSAAVSGGVAIGSEAFSANVEADVQRAAKVIAQQIKDFYLDQGWVQP
jgi:hypothetical protein